MNLTATLYATVSIDYTDNTGRECQHDAEVTYTYDGDELRIIKAECDAFNGWDDDIADELIWEAIAELADEAYAEWLDDRGEYLNDCRADRVAESYIPAGAA